MSLLVSHILKKLFVSPDLVPRRLGADMFSLEHVVPSSSGHHRCKKKSAVTHTIFSWRSRLILWLHSRFSFSLLFSTLTVVWLWVIFVTFIQFRADRSCIYKSVFFNKFRGISAFSFLPKYFVYPTLYFLSFCYSSYKYVRQLRGPTGY